MLCTHLENKQNKSHVPSLWKLPGQKSVKFFLWYFGKLMISLIHYDIIWPLGLEMANPFWERFKTISNMANLIPTSFQLTCSQIVLDLSLTCVLPDWSRLVQIGPNWCIPIQANFYELVPTCLKLMQMSKMIFFLSWSDN